MKRVKNNTSIVQSFCGQDLQPGECYTISNGEDYRWSTSPEVLTAITTGEILVGDNESEFLSAVEGLAWMISDYRSEYPHTWAVDLCNVDFEITGNEWHALPSTRVLWDKMACSLQKVSESVIQNVGIFTIKKDGIYTLDVQLRIKEATNVEHIEIALWKKVENSPDDYWFVMVSKDANEGIGQLSNATQFDFRAGEQYYLAVALTGEAAHAIVDGSDDYSAWGWSWIAPL